MPMVPAVQLCTAPAPSNGEVIDVGDKILHILSNEFLEKEEQQKGGQESPVHNEEGSGTHEEELPQRRVTPDRTRRGRLIKKPVRLGIDE